MATSFYQNVFIVEISNRFYKHTDESVYIYIVVCETIKTTSVFATLSFLLQEYSSGKGI